MVIIRQETLFLYNRAKVKFVPCWAILNHSPSEGPVLCLYTDMTAKKPAMERLALAGISRGIRFGSTSWKADPNGLPAPMIGGSDPKLDKALLIAIPAPNKSMPSLTTEKKSSQRRQIMNLAIGPIWLCALSVAQLFEFIKMLSNSLGAINFMAPPAHCADTPGALRHYHPKAFCAENDWEHFWDNPPPLQHRLKLNGTASRGSVFTVSLDSEVDSTLIGTVTARDRERERVHGATWNLVEAEDTYTHPTVVPTKTDDKLGILTKSKELEEVPLNGSVKGTSNQKQKTAPMTNPEPMVKVPDSFTSVSVSDHKTTKVALSSSRRSSQQQDNANVISISDARMDKAVQTDHGLIGGAFWPLFVKSGEPSEGKVAEQNNTDNCAEGENDGSPWTSSDGGGGEQLVRSSPFSLEEVGTRYTYRMMASMDREEQTASTQL